MAESSVITPAADLTRRVDYLAERVDRLAETVGALRTEIREGLAILRAEMFKREANLLRWMAVFMLAQGVFIVSIIKFL